jgi:ribosomal protein S27E
MNEISVPSNFNVTCPHCGGEMVISSNYEGGTATRTVINEVSSSGSMVNEIYWGQVIYTCKKCGSTLLKPRLIVN